MPKLLFARPLDSQEHIQLESLIAGDNEAVKQRALVVLLSSQEQYRVPEIAPMVGMHVDKVRKWVLCFNDHGIQGLLPSRRKPGSRGKFDPALCARILEIADTSPRELGLLRTTWTLDSLREYLLTRSIVDEISRESLRQILLRGQVDLQAHRWRAEDISRWLQQWQSHKTAYRTA